MGNQAAPFYVNEAINMEEKIVSARGNVLIVSSIHPDDATAVKPQSKFTQGRTAQEQNHSHIVSVSTAKSCLHTLVMLLALVPCVANWDIWVKLELMHTTEWTNTL